MLTLLGYTISLAVIFMIGGACVLAGKFFWKALKSDWSNL